MPPEVRMQEGIGIRMTSPLRAALAACGGVSRLTLTAAGRSPDFSVVAIQDVDPAALARVGDRHGIARRHTAFDDLLTDDVDFVIINSPNDLHLEHVRRAAAAGKPCLVQKPLARSAAEAEALVAAARTAGVKLGVTMFELSNPIHHQVKAMVQSGWLGDPVLVEAVNAHRDFVREPLPPGHWRRDPARVGGGAFIQLGVHHLNLAAWILDRPVARVSAAGGGGPTGFEDETTLATAAFAGGVMGRFAASYAADLHAFSVIGTRGRLHLFPDHLLVQGEAPFEGDVFAYRDAGREKVIPAATLAPAAARLEPRFEVHGRFARWVARGEPYPCPGERGLADLRVVDAVHRARRTGETVTVA